jgi:tRNA modification GTPase
MAMAYEKDTIAAVATPAGTGAVALVRLSGPGSWGVAEAVFRGRGRLAARRVVYGDLVDEEGRIIDDVLVTAFRGPGSYTGEDTVEIACHGGMLVTRRVLELVLRNGARAAEAGEFTRRAFLNGKLDLTQAEAVMDVIGAQSDLALRAAHRQLEGRLGNVLVGLRDELVEVLAHVEAWIDFPEEDIDPDTGVVLREKTVRVAEGVDRLMATAEQGRLLREGVRTVIAGAPNAGKSSLLNRMLGFERALVSEQAGTTRDSIEETINLGGIPVRLVDTAGLRSETADPLEAAGMARTRQELGTADLLLEVVDASQPPAGELEGGESLPVRRLLLLNKADLGVDSGWEGRGGLRVSCRTGEGMDEVVKAVVELIAGVPGEGGDVEAAVKARHAGCLRRAAAALRAAEGQLAAEAAPEFTALDLREALEAMGEVTGRTAVEDVLGVIFARFCIGK